MDKYLCLDLETSMEDIFNKDPNPFFQRILTIGLKSYNKNVAYQWNEEEIAESLRELLKNNNLIIGHNIKYDLLHLWKYSWLQDWLTNGGRIFDTQLAEYILTGQQHKYPALRDIAVNKYGCTEREKHIETLMKQKIKTQDMPIELLLEDVLNDVLDTESIYLQQLKEIEKRNIKPLIETQMEVLLATTEMEYNGMYINKEILLSNKQELENNINPIKQQIEQLASKYWYE